MKKYLLLFLIASLMLPATSCQKNSLDPLGYQVYPFYVEGCLVAEDTEYVFKLTMNTADNSEINFSKPESLRGYVFNVTPEGTTLSYGDMTIDFSKTEKTNLIRLIPSLFALNQQDHVSSEDKILNSVDILLSKYSTDTGEVSVYLNKSTQTPLRFEGEGFVLDVLKFATPSTPEPTISPETTPTDAANSEE